MRLVLRRVVRLHRASTKKYGVPTVPGIPGSGMLMPSFTAKHQHLGVIRMGCFEISVMKWTGAVPNVQRTDWLGVP